MGLWYQVNEKFNIRAKVQIIISDLESKKAWANKFYQEF